jgi:hypothetical protein
MSEISPHIYCLSFTIIFIIILLYIIQSYEKFLELRKSTVLNKNIGVQEKLPDSEKAFKIIESNFDKVYKFVNKLDNKHPDNEDVQRLVRRMDNVKIEESKDEEGTSSYTVNKGELISVCVRFKPPKENFHSDNTMWFVLMHEMAHVMSVSEGHGSEFIKNFKFLLKESESMGMYQPMDYSNNNIVYCGIKVTNNPFF